MMCMAQQYNTVHLDGIALQGDVVAQRGMWWLKEGCDGSKGYVVD
jgi:hypothetical protein